MTNCGSVSSCDVPDGASINPATGAFSWTPADDGTFRIKLVVTDDGSPNLTDSQEITITVANVAPAITAPADQSADEGTAATFALGSFSDPGEDGDWTVTVDWGDGSSGDTFDLATPGDITDTPHTYADDGAYTVTLTVEEEPGDGSAPSDTVTFTITVANVDPVVSLTGPDTADEGDTVSYSYTFTDPGADSWSALVSCGANGTASSESFDATTMSGSFECTWPDNFDDELVSVTVTDDDDGTGSDSTSVDVANVAPTIDAFGVAFDNLSGTITSSVTFSDAGTADTEDVLFSYSWTGTSSGSDTRPYSDRPSASSVVDLYHLGSGCYTIQVVVSVTDDDDGSATQSTSSGTIDFYEARFEAPIKDNYRNVAKWGNVIPLKVVLASMCVPGTTTTDPNLHVTIVSGNQTGDLTDAADDTIIIAESQGNPSSGTELTKQAGGYHYNLSTKKLTEKQYTVRIRHGGVGGPVILRALLELKK